jgi:hypothetical protein
MPFRTALLILPVGSDNVTTYRQQEYVAAKAKGAEQKPPSATRGGSSLPPLAGVVLPVRRTDWRTIRVADSSIIHDRAEIRDHRQVSVGTVV